MAVAALVLIGAGAAGAWIFRAREGRQGPTRDAGPPPMPGDVRLGRLLYYANCQGCHGPEGHGDGAAAAGMRPPPRDFATAPWKFGATAAAVGRVMRDGSPGTAMPGYGLLSEDERAALTAFVLSLAPEEAKSPPRLSADVCDRLRRLGFVPEETPALAPELDLRDLDGMALSWQRGRGKVVLLNFWGTTCVSCLKELPALEKLGATSAPASSSYRFVSTRRTRAPSVGWSTAVSPNCPCTSIPTDWPAPATTCRRCRACT